MPIRVFLQMSRHMSFHMSIACPYTDTSKRDCSNLCDAVLVERERQPRRRTNQIRYNRRAYVHTCFQTVVYRHVYGLVYRLVHGHVCKQVLHRPCHAARGIRAISRTDMRRCMCGRAWADVRGQTWYRLVCRHACRHAYRY